jgi:hypothetical protein
LSDPFFFASFFSSLTPYFLKNEAIAFPTTPFPFVFPKPGLQILKPGFQIPKPGLYILRPGLHILRPRLRIFGPGFQIQKAGFQIPKPGFRILKPGFRVLVFHPFLNRFLKKRCSYSFLCDIIIMFKRKTNDKEPYI